VLLCPNTQEKQLKGRKIYLQRVWAILAWLHVLGQNVMAEMCFFISQCTGVVGERERERERERKRERKERERERERERPTS
jgi:hypothetical protein